ARRKLAPMASISGVVARCRSTLTRSAACWTDTSPRTAWQSAISQVKAATRRPRERSRASAASKTGSTVSGGAAAARDANSASGARSAAVASSGAGDSGRPTSGSGGPSGAGSLTGSSVSTLLSFVAVRRGRPGSVAADRFGLLAVRSDHLLGDVLRHFLIVVERRRERPPAMGQGAELRRIGELFRLGH